jgi:16S rRNA (guanine527-N7)-methyltransferase
MNLTDESLNTVLMQGTEALGIPLIDAQRENLYNYLIFLIKWNRTYNLTAIRDPAQMVTHHFLDSLSIHPYLQGSRLLDVGTGAGLPGLVLAIVFPEQHWVLLDSLAKKTRFLTQAVMELGLANVEIVTARAEHYRPAQPFDIVVTRAVSALSDLVKLTRHLWTPDGSLLAMKGQLGESELKEANTPDLEIKVHALSVPMLNAKRCVAVLRKK